MAILARSCLPVAGGPGRAWRWGSPRGSGALGQRVLRVRGLVLQPLARPRLRDVTAPLPSPSRFDVDSCTYYFSWDSRAACAVKPQEVQMVNGTITSPINGKSISLGDIYFK